jgi:hypothetical protein
MGFDVLLEIRVPEMGDQRPYDHEEEKEAQPHIDREANRASADKRCGVVLG